jgi:hypothetical protein
LTEIPRDLRVLPLRRAKPRWRLNDFSTLRAKSSKPPQDKARYLLHNVNYFCARKSLTACFGYCEALIRANTMRALLTGVCMNLNHVLLTSVTALMLAVSAGVLAQNAQQPQPQPDCTVPGRPLQECTGRPLGFGEFVPGIGLTSPQSPFWLDLVEQDEHEKYLAFRLKSNASIKTPAQIDVFETKLIPAVYTGASYENSSFTVSLREHLLTVTVYAASQQSEKGMRARVVSRGSIELALGVPAEQLQLNISHEALMRGRLIVGVGCAPSAYFVSRNCERALDLPLLSGTGLTIEPNLTSESKQLFNHATGRFGIIGSQDFYFPSSDTPVADYDLKVDFSF